MLAGRFQPGDTVVVDRRDGALTLDRATAPADGSPRPPEQPTAR